MIVTPLAEVLLPGPTGPTVVPSSKVTVTSAGWLPVYMTGIALVVFSPTQWVHAFGRGLTQPVRGLLDRLRDGLRNVNLPGTGDTEGQGS